MNSSTVRKRVLIICTSTHRCMQNTTTLEFMTGCCCGLANIPSRPDVINNLSLAISRYQSYTLYLEMFTGGYCCACDHRRRRGRGCYTVAKIKIYKHCGFASWRRGQNRLRLIGRFSQINFLVTRNIILNQKKKG